MCLEAKELKINYNWRSHAKTTVAEKYNCVLRSPVGTLLPSTEHRMQKAEAYQPANAERNYTSQLLYKTVVTVSLLVHYYIGAGYLHLRTSYIIMKHG